MLNLDSELIELHNLCKDKDWYAEVGADRYGRCVVYVHYMDDEVLRFIPDTTTSGIRPIT